MGGHRECCVQQISNAPFEIRQKSCTGDWTKFISCDKVGVLKFSLRRSIVTLPSCNIYTFQRSLGHITEHFQKGLRHATIRMSGERVPTVPWTHPHRTNHTQCHFDHFYYLNCTYTIRNINIVTCWYYVLMNREV